MRLRRKTESLFIEKPKPTQPQKLTVRNFEQRAAIGGMSLRRRNPNLINEQPQPKRFRNPFKTQPGNYDWIPGWCEGKEVFIIGGDGSLIGFNFEMLNARQNSAVICVNNSIIDCPFADAMVFLDPSTKQSSQIRDMTDTPFRIICNTNCGLDPVGNVTTLQPTTRLTEHPRDGVFSPITSAHMAMTLAIWGRASKIRLLGIGCNQFSREMLPRYIEYVTDNLWYKDQENTIEKLKNHFSRFDILQHYYGLDRRETRKNDKSAYFHMVKSFSIYNEYADKIVSHNFMSRVRNFRQIPIREVIP